LIGPIEFGFYDHQLQEAIFSSQFLIVSGVVNSNDHPFQPIARWRTKNLHATGAGDKDITTSLKSCTAITDTFRVKTA
jgi:hypothetical protein